MASEDVCLVWKRKIMVCKRSQHWFLRLRCCTMPQIYAPLRRDAVPSRWNPLHTRKCQLTSNRKSLLNTKRKRAKLDRRGHPHGCPFLCPDHLAYHSPSYVIPTAARHKSSVFILPSVSSHSIAGACRASMCAATVSASNVYGLLSCSIITSCILCS